MSFSERSQVEPFHAMDVLAEAVRLTDAGAPVISLAVGQPAAPVPASVREVASQIVSQGRLGYTAALGITEARKAIAAHYRDHYGVEIPTERIAITAGSSSGFVLAFLALAEAGGRVAIARPGYPAYRNIIRALSMECVEIGAGEGVEASFDLEALLEEHARKPIDVLLLASPANPTGAAFAPGELANIINACEQAGISFISDEIYHRLRYNGPDETALAHSDGSVIINSFSKYYCMTGWRIGWMVLPQNMVRTVERLAQNLYISAPELSQRVIPAVFEASDDYDAIRQDYIENRAHLLEALPGLGMSFAAPPDGAFYAWCNVSELTNDSMEFAHRMLSEIHVAAAPGVDFDPVNGHRYMRFSYAGTPDKIKEATERIARWLK